LLTGRRRKANGWLHPVGGATLKPPGMGVSQQRANRHCSVASGVPLDGVCSARDQRVVATGEIAAGRVIATTKTKSPPVTFSLSGCQLEGSAALGLPGPSILTPSSQVRLALAADGKRDGGRE
jgi:hypothetical protein